jgi:hypothetical protein
VDILSEHPTPAWSGLHTVGSKARHRGDDQPLRTTRHHDRLLQPSHSHNFFSLFGASSLAFFLRNSFGNSSHFSSCLLHQCDRHRITAQPNTETNDTLTVMNDRSSPSRSLPTHLSSEASLLWNGASRQGSSCIMERAFFFCHSVCAYRPGREAQRITALSGYYFFPFLISFGL